MKIIRRNPNLHLYSTILLWVIPTWTYGMLKLVGAQFNKYEYIWWVTIPLMFIIWLVINYKINNNED